MVYVGARSRMPLERIVELGRSWAVQPKVDGQYAELHLDATGAVCEVRSRSGRPISPAVHQLEGAIIGPPDSVLAGELEAHTESGIAAAERHGRPWVHLFDALRLQNADVGHLPYRQRRDLLLRSRVDLEERVVRGWRWDGRDRRLPDGRYSAAVYPGWHYAPIIEQWPVSHAERLWGETVCENVGEGIVAVSLDAAAGAAGSKRKCKPVDTLDVGIVEVFNTTAIYRLDDGRMGHVATGRRTLRVGELWELAHEGYYADGTPRFPSLRRRRDDIVSLGAWAARA